MKHETWQKEEEKEEEGLEGKAEGEEQEELRRQRSCGGGAAQLVGSHGSAFELSF